MTSALVDIGVNLTNSRFNHDLDEVLSRAQQNKVAHIVITGTNVHESQQALALCQHYQNYGLSCTAGVHPHDADNVEPDYLAELALLASHSPVRAIGECGLDFNRNFSTPENQITVFDAQLALASELSMPVFLHQRDAFEQWKKQLQPYLNKIPAAVAHCFTGNKDELTQCIDMDLYIGITGWVCDERRGQSLYDIVPNIPLNRLMIETDAPYLTPRNIKPKPKSSRNEPSYLPYVLAAVAKAYGLTEMEIAQHTFANSRRFFGLPDA